MRSSMLVSLGMFCLTVLPLSAAQTVTSATAGTAVTLNDNCGFVVGGSTDGWIRLHLVNDDTGSAGRDIWVTHDTYYPLRAANVRFPTDTLNTPSSIVVDDSQRCGYTNSTQLDECSALPPQDEGYLINYGLDGVPLTTNIGFYAGGPASGKIRVKLRSEGPSSDWHVYSVQPGQFFLGGVLDCGLVDGSDVSTLFAVAP